jgi:Tfp pilus assembly protein PilZ
MAIEGTYEVHKVGAKRVTAAPVTIRIGTEIATAGLGVRAKETLAEQSRAQIESMLGVAATSSQPAV